MRTQQLSDLTTTSLNVVAKKFLFSDLDPSFKRNPFTSDIYLKKDIEAVKNSIINIILTGNFERPFQPRFGGNIRQYLFENLDDNTIDTIHSVITNIIDIYEPRAQVIGVYVNESDSDLNRLSITIQFKMLSTGQLADVTTALERVR
jgi:phage baseplate assembly protein W